MVAKFKGFGSIQTNSRNDSARLDEVIDLIKWIDKKWVPIRILPKAPLQVRQAWIKIYAGKDKKEITIPRYVVNFDPENPEKPKKGVRCPYSELVTDKDGPVRVSDFWLFNVIDRDMQDEGAPRKGKGAKPTKEEAKTGFKDINSDTWTPVKVARFTMTMIMRMNELSEDNIIKDKKTKKKSQYDATDENYGFDVKVKYKKDAPGTDKYSIDKVDGGCTPLTKEEKGYLVWDLTEKLLDATGRLTEKQALEDVKRMEIVGGNTADDDDDDDDRKKSKKKSRSLDDDDDDDDDDKKKKKKSKDKKKSKELFKGKGKDDDEDDDDEDDKKSKKSKSKKSSKSDDKKSSKKSSKSSKKSIDDDDDDKPKKSSKKSSKESSWKEDKKPSKKDKGGVKEKSKSKDKDKKAKKKK